MIGYCYWIGLLLIAAGGLLSIFINEKFKAKFILFCAGISAVLLTYSSISVILSKFSFQYSADSSSSFPFGKIIFEIDPLSAFFIFLISIMSFIGSIYAAGYIKPYLNKKKPISSHFFFFSLLIFSMLLVVTIRNIPFFIIVWEIMSISSFFLVAFENEKKEVLKASLQYLITMHIGVICLIVAFLLIYLKTGSYDFNLFSQVLSTQNAYSTIIFILFFVGFGIKAGFIPLHIWLPNAHPAAPSHISALMSGVMIKTGIYGIMRILTYIDTPTRFISLTVLLVSVITAVAGVLYAITQKDMKKLLAYSSIENIGIIGIALGIGMFGESNGNKLTAFFGYSGALLHTFNHSLFKSLLFYGAGSVYLSTHTRNMEKLGGLSKFMPQTSFFFLIGSLAITGLPVFNGFISEILIYLGILNSIHINLPFISAVSILSAVALALTGALALICFTKIFSIVFLGSSRDAQIHKPQEADISMRIASLIITILILIIGIFPQFIFLFIEIPARQFLSGSNKFLFVNPHILLSKINISILTFICIAGLLFFIRKWLLKNKSITYYKTWDCGYRCGNTRMQYTSASYIGPIMNVITPLLNLKIKKNMPEDLFPRKADYELSGEDFVENSIISPVISVIKKFFNLFSWIQSGNTQAYIMYGIIFLIIIILVIMGVKW